MKWREHTNFFLGLVLITAVGACGETNEPKPDLDEECGNEECRYVEVDGTYLAQIQVSEAGDVVFEGERFIYVGQNYRAVYFFGVTGLALDDRVTIDYCVELPFGKPGDPDPWNRYARGCWRGEIKDDAGFIDVHIAEFRGGEKTGERQQKWKFSGMTKTENPY